MPAEPVASRGTLAPPSLHALLAGVVDYAGLFPPANLPLDDALRNYARYRTEPEAWMLARFVLPVRRLDELAPYAGLFADDAPFRFAVLGTGGPDADAFLAALQTDLEHVAAFHRRHGRQAQVDVMEARLPAALLGAGAEAVAGFLDAVHRRTEEALPGLDLFFEAPLDDALPRTAPAILAALAAHNRAHGAMVGFKMRTGGTEPEAFPAPSHLAYALLACREAGVRFKATAGLHHPVRRYHRSVRTRMYGFFNVFGAAVLAAVHALDEAAVRAVLLDEDPAHFRFTPEAFAWRDLSVPVEAVRRARRDVAVSFGSCSFDEPREDLQALGLL